MLIARKRKPSVLKLAPNTLRYGGGLLWRQTNEQACLYAQAVTDRLKSFVAEDERLSTQAPDSPTPSGGFALSDDEFITGTPKEIAQDIVEQCRTVGAGHFLTVLNWSAPLDEVARAHELFGREAIPLLRKE
jgi:hypothetical protein